MTEAEALSKVRSHTANFSKFAIEFEEQVNETRAAQTRVSRAIRVENSKVHLTKEEREVMRLKFVPYPAWAQYRLGNKSCKTTVLKPEYSPKFVK